MTRPITSSGARKGAATRKRKRQLPRRLRCESCNRSHYRQGCRFCFQCVGSIDAASAVATAEPAAILSRNFGDKINGQG